MIFRGLNHRFGILCFVCTKNHTKVIFLVRLCPTTWKVSSTCPSEGKKENQEHTKSCDMSRDVKCSCLKRVTSVVVRCQKDCLMFTSWVHLPACKWCFGCGLQLYITSIAPDPGCLLEAREWLQSSNIIACTKAKHRPWRF